jgi:hypothetical protein
VPSLSSTLSNKHPLYTSPINYKVVACLFLATGKKGSRLGYPFFFVRGVARNRANKKSGPVMARFFLLDTMCVVRVLRLGERYDETESVQMRE